MIFKTPRPLSDFQTPEGEWLEYEQWPHADYWTTCRRDGCPIKDISFQTLIHENVDGSLRCTCAACGQPIDDIVLITP